MLTLGYSVIQKKNLPQLQSFDKQMACLKATKETSSSKSRLWKYDCQSWVSPHMTFSYNQPINTARHSKCWLAVAFDHSQAFFYMQNLLRWLNYEAFAGASNSSINRVLCTGHSGAAAWAQLCGPWAQITYPAAQIRVITFGGPKWAPHLRDLLHVESPCLK